MIDELFLCFRGRVDNDKTQTKNQNGEIPNQLFVPFNSLERVATFVFFVNFAWIFQNHKKTKKKIVKNKKHKKKEEKEVENLPWGHGEMGWWLWERDML